MIIRERARHLPPAMRWHAPPQLKTDQTLDGAVGDEIAVTREGKSLPTPSTVDYGRSRPQEHEAFQAYMVNNAIHLLHPLSRATGASLVFPPTAIGISSRLPRGLPV
jgi:hypothetical protein